MKTSTLRAEPGQSQPAPKFLFYVGIERVAHLHRFPRCFVSINAIRARKAPILINDWIMDSGAFTEITTHGDYRNPPEEYAKHIDRWRLCGNMELAVCQDYMCEPFVTAKTGKTVREHQRLTIDRFDRLRAATDAPLMPVLQGYKPNDYREHLEAYGDRLAYGARVGVGSVCKRNSHPAIIEYLLRGIKADRPDLRLHGFGLKQTALQRPEIRSLLYSADSMAWTYAAWREGRDNHDWREAEAYRKKIEEPDHRLELWNR